MNIQIESCMDGIGFFQFFFFFLKMKSTENWNSMHNKWLVKGVVNEEFVRFFYESASNTKSAIFGTSKMSLWREFALVLFELALFIIRSSICSMCLKCLMIIILRENQTRRMKNNNNNNNENLCSIKRFHSEDVINFIVVLWL